MKRAIGVGLLVTTLAGCCTGTYATKGASAPPDFIIRYPTSVELPSRPDATVRIPFSFVNSAERTICLGKPREDGGWRCGYKPELTVLRGPVGADIAVLTDVSGLESERVKRGRNAEADNRFFVELTLKNSASANAPLDICVEFLLRDSKGKATVMSRAGGPIRVTFVPSGSSSSFGAEIDQPSEMSPRPIDCGFGNASGEVAR